MKEYNEILIENSILESSRLLLRPFKLEDINDVYAYANDEKVTKYLTWPRHKSLSHTEKIVKDFYIDELGMYAIILKEENRCIGCIELRLILEHDKGAFGYVLNRKYWNRGYMTEALNLLLDLAFNKLDLNRVESTHYVGNEGSGRVMEKCGMKYEGKGVQEVLVGRVFHDVVHYAILKEDYMKNHE